MATYLDPTTKQTQFIGSPELNPGLTQGKTLVPDNYGSMPITGAMLTPPPSLTLPTKPQEPNYPATLSSLPTTESILNTPQTATEMTQDKTYKDLEAAIQKYSGRGTAQLEAEQAAGIPDYQKQLNDVNTQIQSLQKEALAIPLQLQEESKGRGITAGGLQPIQTGLLRQNAIKALGLSSIAQTLQGNIVTAQSMADRKVELQFAPVQAQIDYLTKALEINKDKLSREDQKRAVLQQAQLQERQRLLDNAKENAKIAQGMAASAVKFNPNNQAALLAANEALALDPNDPQYLQKVFGFLGQYQSDPVQMQKDVDAHLKAQADIARTTADIAQTKAETAGLPAKQAAELAHLKAQTGLTNAQAANQYAEVKQKNAAAKVAGAVSKIDPESPTFTLDSIRASKGGKIATGEQTKPINKALLVVSQLDSLQSQIANIDTGPIVGILRGANPYDVKAQMLKATLQATVPNLARGIYGEVGVLTDNDVANYIKTLPNIRSQKELNNMVLSMTLKTVKNSVDSNLQVLAAEGRDVAGFEPFYIRLNKKVDEIDGRIGITGTDQYASFRSQLQAGEILVNRNGKATAINPSELRPSDIKL